uniref:Secreted protein n=1 Tax=Panstrongylus lignarius TaxID=156445 RepID=A0A224Y0P2_9HEMI
MAFNFDFDILALFILGDAGVFQCMDCRLVSTSYWNIQVSSHVMMFSINSGSQENLSRSVDGRALNFQGSNFFGTNFAQTFFMFNSSCKIFLTVSLSAFIVSAIIRMLIRRSPRTISLISVTVCGVETETGRAGRWSSSVLFRP